VVRKLSLAAASTESDVQDSGLLQARNVTPVESSRYASRYSARTVTRAESLRGPLLCAPLLESSRYAGRYSARRYSSRVVTRAATLRAVTRVESLRGPSLCAPLLESSRYAGRYSARRYSSRVVTRAVTLRAVTRVESISEPLLCAPGPTPPQPRGRDPLARSSAHHRPHPPGPRPLHHPRQDSHSPTRPAHILRFAGAAA
jgi:hypothetical protein